MKFILGRCKGHEENFGLVDATIDGQHDTDENAVIGTIVAVVIVKRNSE